MTQKIRYNVIVFPGSNCDHDSFHIAKEFGCDVDFVWHKDKELKNPDIIFIPGGFSYGDYLRAGAIATFSPIIKKVIEFANNGGLVIGVCNGFQILTETGLLPGALMTNRDLKFICKHQNIKTLNNSTPFTNQIEKDKILDIPIAHEEGNYIIDPEGLKELEKNNQIIFKYCDEEGNVNNESNPNGAVANIAGICNKEGNVLGMMPHPERAAEDILPSQDGAGIFESINKYFKDNK